MIINSFQGGFDKNLSYLIWCEKTKVAAIIDPSVEITPIIKLIKKYKLNLTKIFITHTHHDHISFLDDFKNLYPNLNVLCYNKSNWKFKFYGLSHNEVIVLGEEFIVCLYTPGHYYDSMCFWDKNNKSCCI